MYALLRKTSQTSPTFHRAAALLESGELHLPLLPRRVVVTIVNLQKALPARALRDSPHFHDASLFF